MEGHHRLGQELGASWPLGPSRLLPERETQVVLGHGPVLRQLLARPDFQGASVGKPPQRVKGTAKAQKPKSPPNSKDPKVPGSSCSWRV
jgi:hypothetical protein